MRNHHRYMLLRFIIQRNNFGKMLYTGLARFRFKNARVSCMPLPQAVGKIPHHGVGINDRAKCFARPLHTGTARSHIKHVSGRFTSPINSRSYTKNVGETKSSTCIYFNVKRPIYIVSHGHKMTRRLRDSLEELNETPRNERARRLQPFTTVIS